VLWYKFEEEKKKKQRENREYYATYTRIKWKAHPPEALTMTLSSLPEKMANFVTNSMA